MKVDKRIGKYNLKNSTLLDDLAYSIYIKNFKKVHIRMVKKLICSQTRFVEIIDYLSKLFDIDFYKEANYLLRIEKINKILKK